MSARPFDLPGAFARIWVDSSIQMLRTTTELWAGLLSTTPMRSASSTASPWWMPPQQPHLTACAGTPWPAAFAISAWGPSWPQAMPFSALAAPGTSTLLPWLPTVRAVSDSNPFALWQQMWLQAVTAPPHWPRQPATAQMPADLWQPVAAAYRTANGHAMAAVLRTMADVVEPKPQGFTPAHYWPSTLGTRH